MFMPQKQKADGASSSTSAPSTSATTTTASESSSKRKLPKTEVQDQPPSKKHKGDKESKPKSDKPASMEEEVRRYLQRRPLSTTELVSKFKKRCQGMSKDEIVKKLIDILKRLKPEQERRNKVLYFSLKKSG